MTFTYSLSDLSSTDTTTLMRALVRLRIGDTDSTDPLLHDEELAPLIAASSSVPRIAVGAVRLILARLARDTDTSGGGINTTRSAKFRQYQDLLAELDAEAALGATPYLGGTSLARAQAIEADPDFKRPAFRVGMHDNLRGARSVGDEEDR